MNKKWLWGIISGFYAISTIVLISIIVVQNENKVVNNVNNLSKKNNTLTMMLETDVGSNEYEVATSNEWPEEGYIFNAEMSACERGSELIWNEETKTVNLKTNMSDTCYIYFDKEPEIIYLADYIKNIVYTGNDGDNDLYYHDGLGNYTNATEEAGDNSYRYAGANPNNYVCFASDETTCLEDNLYRIIGVFDDQVKLIKNTSLGNYYWSGSSSFVSNNIWSNSTLNTGTLNGTYLNGLGSIWSDMIETISWKVGGMPYSQTNTVKQYYTTELGSSSSSTTYNAKIGLMYLSDYGYAASPSYWITELYNYEEAKSSNWLNVNITEWTISRYSDNTNNAFFVLSTGDLGHDSYVSFIYGVRPVFYLKSNVTIIGGDGSQNFPFRLSVN